MTQREMKYAKPSGCQNFNIFSTHGNIKNIRVQPYLKTITMNKPEGRNIISLKLRRHMHKNQQKLIYKAYHGKLLKPFQEC